MPIVPRDEKKKWASIFNGVTTLKCNTRFDDYSKIYKTFTNDDVKKFTSTGIFIVYTECPAKKFMIGKVWNKFKQNFHGFKNISLSSFASIWLNILGHHIIVI